jgi:hypothetical protein
MKRTSGFWMAVGFAICAFIWSGNTSPLLAQKIQVTSATPNSAAQGTYNLNVIVAGSGFKSGATAKWYESGTTNTGGVTVSSTTVNSSSQLTANITVSSTAYVGSFDIVVQNSDGRTGKGTGLFAVTQNGNAAPTSCSGTGGSGVSFNVTTNLLGVDTNSTGSLPSPYQLLSDGLGVYTTYKNSKTDSVTSQIQQNSCDWQLDTTNSRSRTVQLSLIPVSSGEQLPSGWTTDPSDPLVSIPALVMTYCGRNPANTVSVGNMTYVGQMLQCGLHVTFNSRTIQYSVRMNPLTYPGATWGQVVCQGLGTDGFCNSWTITPGVDANGESWVDPYIGQPTAIAELVKPSCNGCAGGTAMGLYYVNFSITVTKP